jgi:heat-inducible transcriptional repressor
MVPLTQRRAGILRLVVHEYVETAVPVGSKAIRDKYDLPASPATIRNEMQALEGEGLLTHPHTSAGRVPSDEGYRFFVESLMGQVDLTVDEKATIRHQFFQSAPELDEWLNLAAALLARSLGLLAIVAPPRARELRVRQVQLIGLQELMALMIVVLQEARVLKQLVTLPEGTNTADFPALSNRVNEQLAGMSSRELDREPDPEDPLERSVVSTLRRVMHDEMLRDIDPRIDGISGVLSQPEFQADQREALNVMSLVDRHALEQVVPVEALEGSGVRVVIGSENRADELQHCTVVMASYGFASEPTGFVGVLGPTRMPYERTVASVGYMSTLLQEMMDRVYG